MKNKTKKLSIIALIVAVIILLPFFIYNASLGKGMPADSVENSASLNKDVIYQIVTDRFYDGNSTNNPTGDIFDKEDLKKYHGGDWQGIIDKINEGYFTNLGITALWISSPVENIMTIDPSNGASSYHGYWAKDFFRPNPAFGSLKDFQNLVKTAHENGIKIIIDFAPNHTSTVVADDVVFTEDGALYRNGELVATYSKDENKYYNHEKWASHNSYENGIYHSLFGLADLNNLNPEIDTYLKEAIDKWLALGIDGIRVDAVKHNSFGWQKNWISHIYENKAVFVFGEWFTADSHSDKNMTKLANDSGMSLLDFRFANATRALFTDDSFTMENFYEVIEETASDYDEVNDQITFIDNHDIARFASIVDGDEKAVELATVLLLTSRGIPAIYYGTENYMRGEKDPENRADMDFPPTTSRLSKIIRKLANLRRRNYALAYGTTKKIASNDDAIVFGRYFGNDAVIVALNRSKTETYEFKDLYTDLLSVPSQDYTNVLDDLLDNSGKNDYIISNKDTLVERIILEPQSAIVLAHTNGDFEDSTVKEESLIGDVSPSMGIAGNTVSISGKNFGKFKGKVFVGGTKAKILSWSDTLINISIAKGIEAGKYQIKVEPKKGKIIEAKADFEVLSAKQIPVRLIINNAECEAGAKVYMLCQSQAQYEKTGDKISEHISENPDEMNFEQDPEKEALIKKFTGPLFNETKSIAVYPSWFYDISVPVNTDMKVRFVKINPYDEIIEASDYFDFSTGEEAETFTFDWK